jgi:hypothetical protein
MQNNKPEIEVKHFKLDARNEKLQRTREILAGL